MIVDARRKFARRIAEWMSKSTLTTQEMTLRLNRWPDDFIQMVLEEHRKLR